MDKLTTEPRKGQELGGTTLSLDGDRMEINSKLSRPGERKRLYNGVSNEQPPKPKKQKNNSNRFTNNAKTITNHVTPKEQDQNNIIRAESEKHKRQNDEVNPGASEQQLDNDKASVVGARTDSTNRTDLHSQTTNPRALQKIAAGLEISRKRLPIWPKRLDIRFALRKNNIMLLVGETGSGKSTQVPQYLATEPWLKKQLVKVKNDEGREEEVAVGGIIAITQPRRVAATTLAHRVAREAGSCLGNNDMPGTVGYSVRFDHKIPRGTKIKFLTEGTLLQEMLKDPHLRQYSAVIIDEIHERSIDVDLISGFLRKIVHGDLKGRGGVPLKVAVMSATLDLGGLEAFFAKPGTAAHYKPGNNHQRIFAPHILEDEVLVKSIQSHQAKSQKPGRRPTSQESFSSWSGIESAAENETDKRKMDQRENLIKPDPTQPDAGRDFDVGEARNGVAIEYVAGRQHPVDIIHEINPVSDYMQAILTKVLNIHTSEPLPGDILVFLTGQDEIETLQNQIEQVASQLKPGVPKLKILPLYGSLPGPAQQAAFEPVKEKFTRKVVLATNIAETSVTVSGVRYVVDCGKSKVKQYRPRLGMESLLVRPISQVSGIQRAGRAGREAPGKCYRIYTETDYKKFDLDEKPEILRSDVIEAVLKMKARGVDNVLDFPLMDSPDTLAMEKALVQLHVMGALDDHGALTSTGKKMAMFPLPAAYGRVLIAASEPGADCLIEAIDIISLINTDSEVFLQPKSDEENEQIDEFRNDLIRREGDLLTYLTTMQRYAAENADRNEWCRKRLISGRAMKMAMAIRKQLRQMCIQQKLFEGSNPPLPDPQPFEPLTPERAEAVVKSFLVAFTTRTALLAPDGSYLTTQGRNPIAIHPSSVLRGQKKEAILFLDHVFTAKNYAKRVSAIQANWIVEALEQRKG